jgi:hypothetical protein
MIISTRSRSELARTTIALSLRWTASLSTEVLPPRAVRSRPKPAVDTLAGVSLSPDGTDQTGVQVESVDRLAIGALSF